MIKLVKHLRPPAGTAAATPAPPQEGLATPPATPGDLPSPKAPPSWGALSKRLMGHLSAVESEDGQPSMPSHSKTTSLQR